MSSLISYNLLTILGSMAHNVLGVYDVFVVAIKEREAFQQPQKCAGVSRGNVVT